MIFLGFLFKVARVHKVAGEEEQVVQEVERGDQAEQSQ